MTDDTTGCSPECHKRPTAENFEYFDDGMLPLISSSNDTVFEKIKEKL